MRTALRLALTLPLIVAMSACSTGDDSVVDKAFDSLNPDVFAELDRMTIAVADVAKVRTLIGEYEVPARDQDRRTKWGLATSALPGAVTHGSPSSPLMQTEPFRVLVDSTEWSVRAEPSVRAAVSRAVGGGAAYDAAVDALAEVGMDVDGDIARIGPDVDEPLIGMPMTVARVGEDFVTTSSDDPAAAIEGDVREADPALEPLAECLGGVDAARFQTGFPNELGITGFAFGTTLESETEADSVFCIEAAAEGDVGAITQSVEAYEGQNFTVQEITADSTTVKVRLAPIEPDGFLEAGRLMANLPERVFPGF